MAQQTTSINQTQTGETLWFKGMVVVGSAVIAGFAAAAIYYFDKIRKNGGCGSVTQSEATSMYYVAVIILIIALIIFIWALVKLLFSKDYLTKVQTTLNTPGTGLFTVGPNGSFIPVLNTGTAAVAPQVVSQNTSTGAVSVTSPVAGTTVVTGSPNDLV